MGRLSMHLGRLKGGRGLRHQTGRDKHEMGSLMLWRKMYPSLENHARGLCVAEYCEESIGISLRADIDKEYCSGL
jgi:hypothetical protein